MPVHRVEQIHVAVGLEVRIEREPETTVVAPVRNFLAEIKDLREIRFGCIPHPDPARAFPHKHSAKWTEGDTGRLAPVAGVWPQYDRLRKTGGHIRGQQRSHPRQP